MHVVNWLDFVMWYSSGFQEIEKYKLGSPKTFHYLNQSKCFDLDGVSDAHDYLATRRAMDIVGISENEQVLFLATWYTWSCVSIKGQFATTSSSSLTMIKLVHPIPQNPALVGTINGIRVMECCWYTWSCASSYPHSLFQEAIFRVVAAVLHLGNIAFAKGKEIDSSVLKDDKSKFHLNTVAELLMYELLLNTNNFWSHC